MRRPAKDIMQIEILERANSSQLQRLYQIFLKAYEVEADLLGIARSEFWPLQQTIDDLKNSMDEVWCFLNSGLVYGAIFLEKSEGSILISNLVVEPQFFRKGIGTALLKHCLNSYPGIEFNVATGSLNLPALQLYKRFGFEAVDEKTVSPNIKITKLRRLSA